MRILRAMGCRSRTRSSLDKCKWHFRSNKIITVLVFRLTSRTIYSRNNRSYNEDSNSPFHVFLALNGTKLRSIYISYKTIDALQKRYPSLRSNNVSRNYSYSHIYLAIWAQPKQTLNPYPSLHTTATTWPVLYLTHFPHYHRMFGQSRCVCLSVLLDDWLSS